MAGIIKVFQTLVTFAILNFKLMVEVSIMLKVLFYPSDCRFGLASSRSPFQKIF